VDAFDYKFAGIALGICILVGFVIEYFSGLFWITGAILAVIALLANAMWAFNEDVRPGGVRYEPGVSDTPKAKARVRMINGRFIMGIAALIVAMGVSVWYAPPRVDEEAFLQDQLEIEEDVERIPSVPEG
jgi:hypothetical protein